ncbi:MAG: hypothetical protein EP338_07855 [Bacteroidetes bacterium]|nr:MAG: hypothetical protein EP338_07855 [Bacteroidota bacterium]
MNLQNINEVKRKLDNCDVYNFSNTDNSFKFFTKSLEVESFRHIEKLKLNFAHPVTIISGTNKIGKTSLLLLLACSHYDFRKLDSTMSNTTLKRHTWRGVLSFTKHENLEKEYNYSVKWRLGGAHLEGTGKRQANKQYWSGLGKASRDPKRTNALIRDREVRFIDLERILPARSFSNSLNRKITNSEKERLPDELEKCFAYILEVPQDLQLYKIGSHVNKHAYLIEVDNGSNYSSYNAASGEEALINILFDIIDSDNNSLLLIDEIEAGFHPNVQRRLADVIQYISWVDKKQFVITTHSPILFSSFPFKSRRFIDTKPNGEHEVIKRISVNAAYSKMDSESYPLLQLYCEDDVAEFIIRNVLVNINQERKHFSKLINIIRSGGINDVKRDYERHKRNFKQMKHKMGFAAIFDGDHKNHPDYSNFHDNPNEFTFFLYPYTAPEKFLVRAYLNRYPNETLETAWKYSDHHSLFQEMNNIGLATDNSDARSKCWQAYTESGEYATLLGTMKEFLLKTAKHFSEEQE